jgi:hypothetical protein
LIQSIAAIVLIAPGHHGAVATIVAITPPAAFAFLDAIRSMSKTCFAVHSHAPRANGTTFSPASQIGFLLHNQV